MNNAQAGEYLAALNKKIFDAKSADRMRLENIRMAITRADIVDHTLDHITMRLTQIIRSTYQGWGIEPKMALLQADLDFFVSAAKPFFPVATPVPAQQTMAADPIPVCRQRNASNAKWPPCWLPPMPNTLKAKCARSNPVFTPRLRWSLN